MIPRILPIAALAMLAACSRGRPDAVRPEAASPEAGPKATQEAGIDVVILVSANAEWRALHKVITPEGMETSPMGAWFPREVVFADGPRRAIFFHGGWGKIDAAASTQYVIDRWKPRYLLNLATCGGLQGRANKGDIFAIEEAITYDIEERMGDSAEAIAYYTVRLPTPALSGAAAESVRRGRIVSADRDIRPADVDALIRKYDADVADWESSAIAHVARRNQVPVYILRGVTDVVSDAGSEAYGNFEGFEAEAQKILGRLVELLGDVTLDPGSRPGHTQ